MVHRLLVEDVVVAGDHHDGQRETVELGDGPVEQRVGDTRVVEQVAGDEHRVDLFARARGRSPWRTPAPRARRCSPRGGSRRCAGSSPVGAGQREQRSTLRLMVVGGAQRGVRLERVRDRLHAFEPGVDAPARRRGHEVLDPGRLVRLTLGLDLVGLVRARVPRHAQRDREVVVGSCRANPLDERGRLLGLDADAVIAVGLGERARERGVARTADPDRHVVRGLRLHVDVGERVPAALVGRRDRRATRCGTGRSSRRDARRGGRTARAAPRTPSPTSRCRCRR